MGVILAGGAGRNAQDIRVVGDRWRRNLCQFRCLETANRREHLGELEGVVQELDVQSDLDRARHAADPDHRALGHKNALAVELGVADEGADVFLDGRSAVRGVDDVYGGIGRPRRAPLDPQVGDESVALGSQQRVVLVGQGVLGVDEAQVLDGHPEQVLRVIGVLAAGGRANDVRARRHAVERAADLELDRVRLVVVPGGNPRRGHAAAPTVKTAEETFRFCAEVRFASCMVKRSRLAAVTSAST